MYFCPPAARTGRSGPARAHAPGHRQDIHRPGAGPDQSPDGRLHGAPGSEDVVNQQERPANQLFGKPPYPKSPPDIAAAGARAHHGLRRPGSPAQHPPHQRNPERPGDRPGELFRLVEPSTSAAPERQGNREDGDGKHRLAAGFGIPGSVTEGVNGRPCQKFGEHLPAPELQFKQGPLKHTLIGRRSSDRHRGQRPRNSQTHPRPSPKPNQGRRGRPQPGAPVFRPASWPEGPRNSQTQPSPSPEPNQRRRGRPQPGAPVFRPASRPKAAKLPNSATPTARTQPETARTPPARSAGLQTGIVARRAAQLPNSATPITRTQPGTA